MKITTAWLKKTGACEEAQTEWAARKLRSMDVVKCARLLIAEGKFDWANWLVAHVLKRKGQIRYAIFAAEQCPQDAAGKAAIEAARAVLRHDTSKTRYAAGYAWAAGAVAGTAGAAAGDTTLTKILEYGIKLLEDKA